MSNSDPGNGSDSCPLGIWSEARFDSAFMPGLCNTSLDIRRAVRRLCEAMIDTSTAKPLDGEMAQVEFMPFHCEAGAPEGALFIDGQIVGLLPVGSL